MSERRSILIVNGSDHTSAKVRRALQHGSERDYEFVDVTTGTDALVILNTLHPTCLVVDYQLPDMAGDLRLGTIGSSLARAMATRPSLQTRPPLSYGGAIASA